ncbi:ABC transporter permease [Candidatus Poriferisodalis sp.]|uniref:ABC transporter permease n=1 Tax=Candidatus Poriferisodalis sp. TaxID=3101277 RepID=UPI003D0F30D2
MSTPADPAAPMALEMGAGAVALPARETLRLFVRNKAAVAGVVLLLGMVFMTVAGPSLYDQDPKDIIARPLQAPGEIAEARLGTDYLGRDVLAGVVSGGTTSLTVAAMAAAMVVIIGVSIGAFAGYYGGWLDSALMRFTEFFQVLPALLFAMVLVALFKPSKWTIAFAIGVVAWPGIARITRAEFLRLRDLEFVRAARALGANDWRIMRRVVFPNALPPLIVSATLIMGTAILFEAGLAFLGLGDPNSSSWGLMIGLNRGNFLTAWWSVTFPGLAIFVTVLSFSLIGDGLQDAYNPKLRGR